MKLLLPAVCLLLSSLGLGAQAPASACRALKHLAVSPTAIALPTRGAFVLSSKESRTGTITFCRVLGQIRSVDPSAQPIRFEVNLPAPSLWNGKAVHFGGGGFDGSLKASNGLAATEVSVRSDPTPLQRGYATFGSDSGHHHHYFLVPDTYNALVADFALNLEERRNFAHDGLKKTHDAAVTLMQAYYGAAPGRMFFLGGSTGGREAYFVTQLWPADYDGVLGAYAGWNQVQLDLQFIRFSKAAYRPGDKLTRGWLPPAQTRLVAAHVLQTCDALDGVKDGIISNPDACRFDLHTLACAAGQHGKGCLTPGQMETFETFATEQRTALPLANSVQSIPGFNITSGTDLTGSMGLSRHPFHPPLYPLNSFYYQVADGVIRFFVTGDRKFNALTFNTSTGGAYASDLLPQSVASDASNANLTPYFAHGGKLILVHGTADATIPTGATTEFYRMMQAHVGQQALDQSVRFYLIPGYGHGHGVFNAGFDALGVLDAWVDKAQTPDHLVATDNNKGQNRRTRPLCVWPTYPRYVAGDVNRADSFACTAP